MINWCNCVEEFEGEYQIINIASNPVQVGTIYCSVCSYENYNAESAHLMISENNGEDWFEYYFEEINPFRRITDFAFLPDTNEMLICVTNNSIYRLNPDILSSELMVLKKTVNTLSNYPNPFNPSTTIYFGNEQIEQNEQIEISIYNIKGQKVKTIPILSNESTNSIVWNGTDNLNKSVSSGVYLYKLNIDGKTRAVNKCLLMK